MVDEGKLAAVLSEFAHTLTGDFEIQGILDRLVELITQVLPVTSAGVTLIAANFDAHYVAASDAAALRFEQLQSSTDDGPCVLAFQSGEPVQVPDLLVDDRFPAFMQEALDGRLGAMFAFPLRHGDGRLGALDLYSATPLELSERDVRAAQALADVAAAYLLVTQARDDARAQSDLYRHNALHDPLTGLPNRTLLQERLEHAARRAQRTHSNIGVVFVDLDDFKSINDIYGHRAGDDLLVEAAGRMLRLVRAGDTLARVGGDEFIFLLEDLRDADNSDILIERVVAMFDEPFDVLGTLVPMRASVGCAFAGPGDTVSLDLLDHADRAMYAAKRRAADSGRGGG